MLFLNLHHSVGCLYNFCRKEKLKIFVPILENSNPPVECSESATDMGEPISELYTFGWTIMSSGKVNYLSNLTQNSADHEEQLRKLDVTVLQDIDIEMNRLVYNRFKN